MTAAPSLFPPDIIRLPFLLGDWTRVMWTNNHAHDVWAPRIQKITSMWEQLEKESVVAGIRPSSLTILRPEQLVEEMKWAGEKGLAIVPLQQQGVASGYSSTSVPMTSGGLWGYRVAYTLHEHVKEWTRAWDARDDDTIGRLLGYPPCCQAAFRRVWAEAGCVDTTWQMACATPGHTYTQVNPTSHLVELAEDLPIGSNGLLRWLGVRLAPQMPCSFACQPSADQAHQYTLLAQDLGFNEEVGWMHEMLHWPAEWSALHGIAEIKLPVLKISTRTDATGDKYIVRRPGRGYPEEGANGVLFPYRPNKGNVLTKGKSYNTSLEDSRIWTQNGFSSREAMDVAHEPILKVLWNVDIEGKILDPGCGNGELLYKICGDRRGLTPCGVEIDRERLIAASRKMVHGIWAVGDIADTSLWADQYDLIIFMPGRLLEMDAETADKVRLHLSKSSAQWLLYGYDDNLKQHGGLAGLCRAAGMAFSDKFHTVVENQYAAAVLLSN